MIKEQTFRSEDMPFGIANGKSQIPKYGICNLRSEIPSASEDSLFQVCASLSFNCGILDQRTTDLEREDAESRAG
jgi:hypothetical protein